MNEILCTNIGFITGIVIGFFLCEKAYKNKIRFDLDNEKNEIRFDLDNEKNEIIFDLEQ